ncbi:hypothetical protein CFC21_044165 [Triticum aestivum]|uniref:NB-ARC domain-containing protein n=3 Tax=Triticum TaxID=4564 RepID=A0A9R1JXA2_WHEAT|nr:hypothetical protein CFC21_044165 [Triticum aestivum]CDM86294.1 unnamed protein product [Triticum aestivum]VAH84973.1 unnamed protein product [Triticum turgidum subsp. durum]
MGALGHLLPKLGAVLAGEFTLEKRVRKGIESLETELTLMHAALRKVAKVPPKQLDELIKIWAGKVKELSYEMEDILDAFIVHVEDGGEPSNPKKRVKKILKKTMKLFKKGKVLHQISDALEEVVHQAKQLAEQHQRYVPQMRDTSVSASVDPRMMALYTDVTELVGIEETREKLIDMLTEGDHGSNQQLKTISIVGFCGLGKTTLAKAAYDKIKGQFQCDSFVSVSQNPDMKKVFKNILYELDKENHAHYRNEEWEEKQLIDELIKFLNGKRYLIVIDDIWDKEVWKLIKCAFSKKSPGSRLITTTRIISVSEACCSSRDDIYIMKPLSDDVSRTLFYRRVFSHETECPQELVQVSKEILKKCGGIPLAIISIASLLANNPQIITEDQWYDLLNSIGRGLTEDQTSSQKTKIMKDKLIWRWISEGFLNDEKQEASLYELGNRYFNELVNRSMVQPICNDYEDEKRVEACRVHDMVLDLISSLSSQENFVTILDVTRRKMPNPRSKVRRMSIQNSKIDVDTTRMAHMRSLTVFANNVVGEVLDISSCQVLRVLDLEGCDVSDIGYVGNLLHLRYLGLKETHVEDLPMEIGKLQFLITLDLRGVCDTDLNVVKELGRLTKLKVLRVLYDQLDESSDKALEESLGYLKQLESLWIEIFATDDCINFMSDVWVPPSQLRRLDFPYSRFLILPAWINPSLLPVLTYLRIFVDEVRSDVLELLGKLPALCVLEITDFSKFNGEHLMVMPTLSSGANTLFPRATHCSFLSIGAVPSMFPQGAAPMLKHLTYAFSAKWISSENLDLDMGHLPSLERLNVMVFNEEASDWEVEEAQDVLWDARDYYPNHLDMQIDLMG